MAIDYEALRKTKQIFKDGHDIGTMWIEVYEAAKASDVNDINVVEIPKNEGESESTTQQPVDKSAALCTGCGEESMVRVALIGDIKICPKCVHLMMSIIENEAHETVTWRNKRESSQPDDCGWEIYKGVATDKAVYFIRLPTTSDDEYMQAKLSWQELRVQEGPPKRESGDFSGDINCKSCGFSHPLGNHGWQPIETAPKDELILIARRHENELMKFHYVHAAYWCDGWAMPYDGERDNNGTPFISEDELPTDWMPLPEPPEQGRRGSDV